MTEPEQPEKPSLIVIAICLIIALAFQFAVGYLIAQIYLEVFKRA